jgi:hypothetical protein
VLFTSGRSFILDTYSQCRRQHSFGSVMFPPTQSQMETLIDVFDSLGSAYIMVEGNSPEEVKTMLRQRVGVGSNRGLLVKWAPQRAILSHQVCKHLVVKTYGSDW